MDLFDLLLVCGRAPRKMFAQSLTEPSLEKRSRRFSKEGSGGRSRRRSDQWSEPV